MKRSTRFFLIALSALLFTCWNGPLSLRFGSPARSMPSPIELAQASLASNRLATFIEADQLYRQGNMTAAADLYRQVKPEFATYSFSEIPEPIYEPEALAAENAAYWTTAQTSLDADDATGAIVALEQLNAAQPEFIPGLLQLAELLRENDREDEALAVLEQAAALYPNAADVVMAQVQALSDDGEHLEAAIAAREFAVLNLDHPQAGEFEEIAEEELDEFTDSRKRESAIGGALSVLGGILSGNRVPWESFDSAVKTYEVVQLMLSDEAEFGEKVAEEYKQQLSLVEDPVIVDYVTQLGLEVAQLMGRDFDYEFYVVNDSAINAFALPGGKIFVNTGAILAANSQAELAGVLAHEAAHAVFSHGIQSFFRNDLLSQFSDEIPMGEFVTGLISMQYSRDQERDCDILGSRVLATAGYAADGLRNFMATLGQSAQTQEIEFLSSHPTSDSRVQYLEELIQRNGYNRYALEGVDKHSEIQAMLS